LIDRKRLSHSTLKPFLSSFSVFHELKFGRPFKDISLVKDFRNTATKHTKVSPQSSDETTSDLIIPDNFPLAEEGSSVGFGALPQCARPLRIVPEATWRLYMWSFDVHLV
jgi:hypothetical protein